MNKYIITWDAGYGSSSQIVVSDSLESAKMMAYDAWKEEANANAEYYAHEFNEDDAVIMGAANA